MQSASASWRAHLIAEKAGATWLKHNGNNCLTIELKIKPVARGICCRTWLDQQFRKKNKGELLFELRNEFGDLARLNPLTMAEAQHWLDTRPGNG